MQSAMRSDPKGYYARLDIAPGAPREAIAAAYRRKARVLHPDIPVTGNAAAFVAMKEAYEVLADPLLRAAYDRAAKTAAPVTAAPPRRARTRPPPTRRRVDEAEEILPDAPPPLPSMKFRHPRLSDVPALLWAALVGVVLLAGVQAVRHLIAEPVASNSVDIPATAPRVTPASIAAPPAPVRLAGAPNAYVLPAGGAAVVWRYDPQRDGFVPLGHVPPFSAVQVLRVLRENGLVEVRLGQATHGFIDANRLTAGTAEAAHQAYCAYNAGPEPANAEVLSRSGSGPVAVTLVNRSGQPAVVKLRTPRGVSAATVFLAPNGQARVTGLPAEPYRPDFAIGELWSRSCNSFAAGMRAQRFAGFIDITALSPLSIPPDLSPGPLPVDIPDKVFEQP